jgi:DNA mismatch repair protein MutL
MGTTVEVRDLFFNVPARRKFLRTDTTEYKHIETVVQRIALSRPATAITFTRNGKKVLQLPAGDMFEMQERRIQSVCGDTFISQSHYLDFPAAELRLSGWIGLPVFSRSQTDLQYFFVNGRAVRDKLVTHAVRQAYQDVLYHGRHPAFVLNLEIDPRAVDVNAHPAKHEVRFRDSRLVHDFLFRTIHKALADVRPVVDQASATTVETPASSPGYPVPQQKPMALSVNEQITRYAQLHPQPIPAAKDFIPPPADDSQPPPLGYALAQLKGIYILAENANGLILVDMHAAHERISYEHLKQSHADEGIRSQPLLVPMTLSVSQREADQAEQNQRWFSELGFEVDRLGQEQLAIRQVPALLADVDIEALPFGSPAGLRGGPRLLGVSGSRDDQSDGGKTNRVIELPEHGISPGTS